MTIVHLQNCIFINGIYFPLCLIFFCVNILTWEELWVMKKQCKRALLSLASICMCLTSGIGIFAENEQTPVTYTNGDYTFEKISLLFTDKQK